MKKILFIVLLGIAGLFAQTNYPTTKWDAYSGRGCYVSDSLYQAWVDTSATPDDTLTAVTSKTIALGLEYDWVVIEIVDTGSVFTDSIFVESAQIEVDASGTPIDTSWHVIPLRDSSWTIISGVLVGNGARKSYLTFAPLMETIRVRSGNSQTAYSRTTYFNITGIKKKQEN